MRVALLTPTLQPGGAERQMLYLAGALPSQVFDVRLIAMSERGPLADEAEALGLSVSLLGLRRDIGSRHLLGSARDVLTATQAYLRLTRDVDVVDAWLVPAYTFAGLVQPIARIPAVLAGRRSALDVRRTRRWHRELAGLLAMRAMTGVVANSQAAADQAIADEGLDPAKVHVIRNAVIGVEPNDVERSRLRAGWGFSRDDVVVGTVGTYKSGKGHDMMLDVASYLLDRQPSLRFVFLGSGPLKEALEREVGRRGLTQVVKLRSAGHDARGSYQGLDILAQASESEGLPNVVLEAAAAARAIVATAVGGTAEIITSGENGLLVSRGDAKGLADGIAMLASDHQLRARYGDAAASRSREFSPGRLADKTGALYLRLAHR